MCEDHRHLGWKTTVSYSWRNFADELELQDKKIKQIWEKRSQILEDLNKEITNIFNSNNELKIELSKETWSIPEITEKSEQELLSIFNTLKEENDSLVQELNAQKAHKETVKQTRESFWEKEKEPEIVVPETIDKKEKRPFLRKLIPRKNK